MNPLLSSILSTVLMVAACVPIFYIIERINPIVAEQKFYRKEFFSDLLFALSNGGFVAPVLQMLILLFLTRVVGEIVPFQIFANSIESLPLVVQVVVILLIVDFVTYWRHRFTHVYAWPFHSVHHAAEEISWLTKFRLHPGDLFFAILFYTVGMHIIGFGGLGLTVAIILYQAYDLFAHCNIRVGLRGWPRFVFATPQFHRWHHAVEPEAINKNYCVMFSFYDWLFGSFYCPDGVYPSCYGLTPGAQEKYPTDFLEQLAYPFRKIFKRIRSKAH